MRFSLFFLLYFNHKACFFFIADCHFAVYGLFLIQLLFWLRASLLSSLSLSLCDSLACLVSRGFRCKGLALLPRYSPNTGIPHISPRFVQSRNEFLPRCRPLCACCRAFGRSELCTSVIEHRLVFYRQ